MSKGKIFTAQEVQSILSGNKTMFREVIKNKTSFEDFLQTREVGDNWYKDRTISMRGQGGLWGDYTLERFVEKFCPYQVGQKIFVKESFNIFAGQVAYKQNLANVERYIWKPASQMKQEHSRLTLLIKEIRAEKLQHISQEDCEKEGIGYTGGWNGEDYDDGEFFFGKLVKTEDGMNWKNEMFEYADLAFEKYWNSTHKKPEEKFGANPFVWSIRFEVVK